MIGVVMLPNMGDLLPNVIEVVRQPIEGVRERVPAQDQSIFQRNADRDQRSRFPSLSSHADLRIDSVVTNGLNS